MRALGGTLIEMKRLWVKSRGESLDFVRLEGVAADRHALANHDVFEIFHWRAPALRRSTINGHVRVVSTVSRSSSISCRHITKPKSGRLLEARVSSTVVRTRTSVFG